MTSKLSNNHMLIFAKDLTPSQRIPIQAIVSICFVRNGKLWYKSNLNGG